MIRVLICEDEKRICKLIQNIIDWEELGFEIVDVAHTGTDAIEKIKLYNPNVVITDIRMPGCTGIEMIQQVKSNKIKFIIISGYKQFEYAQSAIKYGVEDYILKPIDKSELTNALIRIKRNLSEVNYSEEKDMELKNSKEKIKNNLITYALLDKNFVKDAQIDTINSEFKVSFKKGKYQAMYLKLFNNNEAFDNQDIFNILVEDFTSIFSEKSYDLLHNTYNGGLILFINYNEEYEKVIQGFIKEYLNITKKLILKFKGVSFILSLGKTVSSISELNLSLVSSINGIKYRIKYGLNTLINTAEIEESNNKGKNILSDKDIWKLKNIIESFNCKDFAYFIDKILLKIHDECNEEALCFFETLEYINNTILETFKYMDLNESIIEELTAKYEKIVNFEMDKTILMNKYKLFVLKQLEEISLGTNKKELTVVTKAKKYISDNYQNPITLEEVAEEVKISPAYLSTMFKKELGINFSDYIIELRVERAKNILKNTNLSIAEVTEEVGYTDCRYFSKLFNKVVGIKPSKYRKLYNKG